MLDSAHPNMLKTNSSSSTEKSGLLWEVHSNQREFHRRRRSFLWLRWGRYSDNVVRSHKYSPLTFLPLNLYEQFQRVANLYFLLMVVMQCVPAISTLRWYTSLVPLLTVLLLRGVKDLATDLGRRRSDAQINRRPCDILTAQGFKRAQWKDVHVGDILQIQKDQIIPADILLLCSSEPHSACYVETADIDGETNLKFRQAPAVTHTVLSSEPIKTEELLQAFDGVVVCDEPHSGLYSFRGELLWRGERHLLDIEHILLRGTTLRNTHTVHGVAIYTGADTKVSLNFGRLQVKRTQVERMLNRVVLGIVVFLLVMALLLAVGTGCFQATVVPQIEALSALTSDLSPAYTAFLTYWGYLIILSPAMPMTLYITLEVVHMVHCLLIGWDVELYGAEHDSPAHAHSTSLNEELGEVGHLLSDKTGTLTQNRLLLRQCCIAGEIYGDASVATHAPKFCDQRLVERLVGGACAWSLEFVRALALCHTAVAEQRDGELQYQASSPDEGALLCTAQALGWEFMSRTRDTMLLRERGRSQQYQLLTTLPFTSQRKRMAVLVRDPEGCLKLYCKGADLVILERLQKESPHRERTERALELFAQGCMRTLCVAVRSITEESWQRWSHALSQAAMATMNRESLLEALYAEMEAELMLLGATAIEDRLQIGVPETISSLRRAGINIWVLTGDKTETAVNVGYSCKLMDPDTRLLQGQTLRELLLGADLASAADVGVWSTGRGSGVTSRGSRVTSRKTTLVITGQELAEVVAKPELGSRLVSLASHCQAVLCCRATPGQKAEVVQLLRKHSTSITMAIGDGANDVNMIKTAHVGVGLCGVEGSQAVQNADFSLAEFRFLRRLLLVHGRWSYLRICCFLRYFLYKTCGFALVHVWYSFYCGFSAQSVYENWFIALFTAMYTSMSVQCLAVFEQDVSAEGCLCWPEVFRQRLFSPVQLAATLLYALYTSIVLLFLPLAAFHDSALDFQTFSVTVATSAVFSTTVEVILQTKYWTKYSVAAVILSLLLYFLATLITQSQRLFEGSPSDYYYPGAAVNAFSFPMVWLTVLLSSLVAVLPSVAVRALSLVLHSPHKHKVHSVATDRQAELKLRRAAPLRRSSHALTQPAVPPQDWSLEERDEPEAQMCSGLT